MLGKFATLLRPGTTPDPGTARPLTCLAHVSIHEDDVIAALEVLTTNIRSLRKYRASKPSIFKARVLLVDALNAVGQETKRSSQDVGVQILGAHGMRADLETVYRILAPFIVSGSYLRSESGEFLCTFDDGGIAIHERAPSPPAPVLAEREVEAAGTVQIPRDRRLRASVTGSRAPSSKTA